MRTEQEMNDLILGFARGDDRVRALTIEGSRMNENAPRDCFQDYDISFIVTELDSFKADDRWLDVFGPRIIMQKPEGMALFPPSLGGGRFSYLMLFEDGNRIDLTLVPLEGIEKHWAAVDTLTKVLLDKDGICPELDCPSDFSYCVRKPSPMYFNDCANEFWWLATYVVKGLCRNEFHYAVYYFQLMRKQLFTVISWNIGFRYEPIVSTGKAFKYLDSFMSDDFKKKAAQTYRTSSPAELRETLINTCHFFEVVAWDLSAMMNCPFPDYGKTVLPYLKKTLQENPEGTSVISEDELLRCKENHHLIFPI